MKRSFILLTFLAGIALSCNDPTPAPPKTGAVVSPALLSKMEMAEKNKETALAAKENANNHDLYALVKALAPDYVEYGDGSAAPIKGADAAKASYQELMTAFPDMKNDNMTTIAEENRVAVFSNYSGTLKGALMGMKPTGKSFKTTDVDFFVFNEAGLISKHYSVQSFETVLRMVGANMKK